MLEAVRITIKDLDHANHDDQTQSHQFPHGEDVLDPGGHTNTGAVHPGQQHWNTTTSLILGQIISVFVSFLCHVT